MKKNLLFLLLFSACCLCRAAVPTPDYEQLEAKAQRFFHYKEWSSANAMYVLMLEQQPSNAKTYALSAVANIMAGDTLQALETVPRSMKNEVPFDSLTAQIKAISFSIGRGDLYEHYLLDVKRTFPWLSRVADNYLMKYYAFRQNGPELVKYARMMLAGLPDNHNFLRMLAHGLMLCGDSTGAEQTWLKVISLYPDNYDTMLDLANYYDAVDNRAEALAWMQKVYAIRPTPYVAERIDFLKEKNMRE